MLQDKITHTIELFEKMEENFNDRMTEFCQQWYGRNLKECLPEIEKHFRALSIYRGNVTFINHYPRRTVRPQIEIEKNNCRLNTYHLPLKHELDEEFCFTIKKIYVVSDSMKYGDNYRPTLIPHVELDDSTEFVIEH